MRAVRENSIAIRPGRAALGACLICVLAMFGIPAVAQAANVDLGVSQTDNPDPARNGQGLTYAIQVSNAGPDRAKGVRVVDKLSPRVNFLAASSPRASVSCRHNGRRVACSVGRLDAHQSTRINVLVNPALERERYTVVNTVSVRKRKTDSNPANNRAKERTSVENPPPVNCVGRQATIVGTNGDDTLIGTDGPDVIAALSGTDNVIALGGDDLVCGSGGNDKVQASGGADWVKGGGGNDKLKGGDGDDRLQGKSGRDRLKGGRGNDALRGGHGKDRCRGGGGNDSRRSC